MLNASRSHVRWDRTQTLVLGGLLLGGFCLLLGIDNARSADQPKGKSKGNVVSKAPAVPAWPTPPRMTIVAEGSDTAEMAKIINEKLEAGWKANKVVPSHYINDYEFIRRASLDIVGRIATPAEIRAYMKDAPDRRRSMLIERLLKHEDYARHWANQWSNWLLTRSGDFGKGKYHEEMIVWLEEQFSLNKSYAEIATKLLTASGKNDENGATNFILAHVGERIPNGKTSEEGQYEMVPLTSRITRVFLGTQVQCAQCHAHPFFNSLKQESFWGINAFLRQVRSEGPRGMRRRMGPPPSLTLKDDENVNPDANVYFEQRNGKVRMWHAEFLPSGGKDRGPRLDASKRGLARREELARFLVENEMFSKAMVNRMWGLFFGRGFVNPIDDFNDNNQPSNPELLNELATRFKHYNYDLKKLIRWITHSNAYHLSYVANVANDKAEHETLFARMIMKSLSPEQLFESLMVATGAEEAENSKTKKEFKDKWLGSLISNFGDDEGNEVNFNGTIVQALMMMNGKEINDAISRPNKGSVAPIMAMRGDSINELYLTALNRPVRPKEKTGIMKAIGLTGRGKDNYKARYEDLFWALLNSNEFLLNH
jgi:hypothetical protein